MIFAYHSVPLIAVLYYMCGAAAFGLARGNTPLDIALFPLQFTTSGGLDSVSIFASRILTKASGVGNATGL